MVVERGLVKSPGSCQLFLALLFEFLISIYSDPFDKMVNRLMRLISNDRVWLLDAPLTPDACQASKRTCVNCSDISHKRFATASSLAADGILAGAGNPLLSPKPSGP